MSSITQDSVGREIYPKDVDVLKAFDLCGPDDVRVIIIGQDCYHGQATGILKSTHPSPLSANRGGWFGTKHFSRINDILDVLNEQPIIWGDA